MTAKGSSSKGPASQDPFRVDGATALITGGGTGIGQACALALARAGLERIWLVGRRLEPLMATAAAVREAAPQCITKTVACDITDPAARKALVTLVKGSERLDFIVNNAGLFFSKGLRETSDEDWRTMFAVNVDAPFALIRDLIALLETAPGPAIVSISSTLAEKPIPGTAAYNAAKAALIQMSRSLALELGPSGIRVNCIMPAIIETAMYRERYATDDAYAEGMKQAAGLHPLGRVGAPQDVALAVQFLLSPASSWMTGVTLPVDGGMLVT